MLHLEKNKKGQATVELAIMGSIVIMLLAYLLQQGYIYNARQALEMYTFREALNQSRQQQRGITLTVIRDVLSPSFFSAINKERLQAAASVEYNPWKIYIPDVAQDVPNRQLVQIDEAMIRNKLFFEVPPTKVRVDTKGNKDQDEQDKWQWINSAVREIDTQSLVTPSSPPKRESEYTYITRAQETGYNKTITKELSSDDTINTKITFENKDKIIKNYLDDDWTPTSDNDHILRVNVEEKTIPPEIQLQLKETVKKTKTTITPH